MTPAHHPLSSCCNAGAASTDITFFYMHRCMAHKGGPVPSGDGGVKTSSRSISFTSEVTGQQMFSPLGSTDRAS